MQKLYNFVSGSYVHLKWLALQKELYPEQQPRELQRLTDVRWACRYMACRNLRDRLPAVVKVLQDIALENSDDRSVDARGILSQIDVHFIGLLVIFCKVLGDAKYLSDMLQSSSLDLARVDDLVGALTDTLQNYRSERFFGELWKEVEEIVEHCKISVQTVCKRQPKTSLRRHDSLIMSTVGQKISNQSYGESFQRAIFYQMLDSLTAELQKSFSK